ncbi:MAG: DUF3784 domain-containing protein [Flammeovirgaceae bacterium]|jgi:hypothetical protein|nr:DUF3784 domain-containing protein [Flammeovirgaceae bacterium]
MNIFSYYCILETADIILFSSIALVQLTFLGIPYLIKESNAKYYLAGYNTLSEEDRDNYDLKGYLAFQKNFLTQYSLSTAFIFIIFYFTFVTSIAFIIYVIALLIPLPYFTVQGNKFKQRQT